jgi:hypothetical protein
LATWPLSKFLIYVRGLDANLLSIEFIAFLTIILLSFFENDRQQQIVGKNSIKDRAIDVSPSS